MATDLPFQLTDTFSLLRIFGMLSQNGTESENRTSGCAIDVHSVRTSSMTAERDAELGETTTSLDID